MAASMDRMAPSCSSIDRMAPSCSSMPVKRSSTRRSASGSPASRGAAVSARTAEGPLPAAGAAVRFEFRHLAGIELGEALRG